MLASGCWLRMLGSPIWKPVPVRFVALSMLFITQCMQFSCMKDCGFRRRHEYFRAFAPVVLRVENPKKRFVAVTTLGDRIALRIPEVARSAQR